MTGAAEQYPYILRTIMHSTCIDSSTNHAREPAPVDRHFNGIKGHFQKAVELDTLPEDTMPRACWTQRLHVQGLPALHRQPARHAYRPGSAFPNEKTLPLDEQMIDLKKSEFLRNPRDRIPYGLSLPD